VKRSQSAYAVADIGATELTLPHAASRLRLDQKPVTTQRRKRDAARRRAIGGTALGAGMRAALSLWPGDLMLAIRCEIFGSLGSFHHGLVGVALEHQGGDAPNVDLRYQNARLMKSAPGLSMTLGNAAAARVRLIVWCKACSHQVEPGPAEMARQYGADIPVRDWCERLVCSKCGSRQADMVVTGTERR
jgi:hypothetical protein